MKALWTISLTLALTLSAACTEWGEFDDIASLEQSSLISAGPVGPIKIKPKYVSYWEDHNGSDLWPNDAEGVAIVLYPADRGWGAYLFVKKNGDVKKVGNFQGKPENFTGFLGENMTEWEEKGTSFGFDDAVMGSIKKKPPKIGPGNPPGEPPKKHVALAKGVAQKGLSGMELNAGKMRLQF